MVTLIGLGLLLTYIMIQVMNFYGIDQSAYGTYVVFYLFILLSLVVLPNNSPTLNMMRTLRT